MLPKLPRVLKKVEAQRTHEIMKMLLRTHGTCVFEVKRRGNKLKPHQLASLKAAASDKGMCWKIRDDGSIQPFDGFCARNANAFIVWIEKDRTITIEKVHP
jgi:hypothetical protein